ncbi:group 1 truncated hemoglobin [Halomonas aquamarina]|uniref:Group 1 truncated hemoglobin n=1 Tax=Vreelandella aquamarina TaxID=77097 RepID=A0ACC5VRK9_9GAMM|nr:group 1 truncated hemoglobin [Halomonas aquamarina]MBZ5486826.1 group 1 truncated hemoglobin [Halomonas aquamarina]
MHRTFLAFALAGLTLMLAACAQHQSTLYERLGGQTNIDAIVENFLYRVADDTELVGFFANTNIDKLAASLGSMICDVSGGPCHYEGPPMDRAHQHMGVKDRHFNRLVEHLDAALAAEGVALNARNALLGQLAPMYGDVMRYQ